MARHDRTSGNLADAMVSGPNYSYDEDATEVLESEMMPPPIDPVVPLTPPLPRRRTSGRWWIVLVFTTVLGVLAGSAWSYFGPASYSAEATAFVALSPRPADVANREDPFAAGQFVLQRMGAYAQLGTSIDVLQGVLRDIGRGTVTDLERRVRVIAMPGTVLLHVSVVDRDRQTASRLANSVIANLNRVVADAEVRGGASILTQLPSAPSVPPDVASAIDAQPIITPNVPPLVPGPTPSIQGRWSLVQITPVRPATAVAATSAKNHWLKPLTGLLVGLLVGGALMLGVRSRNGSGGNVPGNDPPAPPAAADAVRQDGVAEMKAAPASRARA